MPIYNYVNEVQKKVEERLTHESVTEGLFSKQYSFSGVRTITTKNVENVALTPYDRTLTEGGKAGTIGNRFGDIHELASTTNEYTMLHEVKYNLGWDKGANTDEHEIRTASSVISRQDREIIVPYRDKYRLMRLAEGAGLKKYGLSSASTGELSRKNIVETLLKARAEMANNFVPIGKQVLYIGETAAIEMKLADLVVGSDILSEKPIVNGELMKLGGFQLKIVPDSYFDWTDINANITAANNGQTTVNGNLGFLIVTKGCGWSPVKVKTSRVDTTPSNFDGTQILYHEYFDCFVNKTRNVCVYAGWTSADPNG